MFEAKMDNTYMTINQVAEHLSVSVANINRWRRNRDFPAARQFSPGCVRWRRSDLVELEESRATCFVIALDDQDEPAMSLVSAA